MRTLDSHWERRTSHLSIPSEHINALVAQAGFQSPVQQYSRISTGLANTNFKIVLQDHPTPLFLRIWTRDPKACQKEYLLNEKLQSLKIPVARFLYADWSQSQWPYSWAILSWLEGVQMTKVLLNAETPVTETLYRQAAEILSQLSLIRFPSSGFFDETLNLTPLGEDAAPNYLYESLSSVAKAGWLTVKEASQLTKAIEAHEFLIQRLETGNQLVHADYKPSNFLVTESENSWSISGIVDWEFAFSSTPLFDVGTLLRFENELGDGIPVAIQQGYGHFGERFPSHWYKTAKLLDLFNLFSFLERDLRNSPNIQKHCLELVRFTTMKLKP